MTNTTGKKDKLLTDSDHLVILPSKIAAIQSFLSSQACLVEWYVISSRWDDISGIHYHWKEQALPSDLHKGLKAITSWDDFKSWQYVFLADITRSWKWEGNVDGDRDGIEMRDVDQTADDSGRGKILKLYITNRHRNERERDRVFKQDLMTSPCDMAKFCIGTTFDHVGRV